MWGQNGMSKLREFKISFLGIPAARVSSLFTCCHSPGRTFTPARCPALICAVQYMFLFCYWALTYRGIVM